MLDPRTRKRDRPRLRRLQQRSSFTPPQIPKLPTISLKLDWFHLCLTLLSWGVLGFIVTYVRPEWIKDWILPESFLSLFMVLATSLVLLLLHFLSLRRSLSFSLAISSLLFLQLHRFLNIWYGLIILGLVFASELVAGVITLPQRQGLEAHQTETES